MPRSLWTAEETHEPWFPELDPNAAGWNAAPWDATTPEEPRTAIPARAPTTRPIARRVVMFAKPFTF